MNKLFLILAITVPLLTAYDLQAASGDLWVDVNLASIHTNADSYCYKGKCDDYNERNYGLGLSYDLDGTFEVTGGFFRNSYDKHSNYLGVKVKHDFHHNDVVISPGVTVGFVTGYDNTEVEAPKYQAIGVPSVTASYKRVRATVGYIPLKLVTDAGTDVVTFQLGIKF